ncbi:hypothetical protein AMECASPLE_001655 [Ameca splendens]|uniref:Uncharacterized protein n=1 Tax=Ameca splendens TaxID=208324 RepID=A0ABV0Z6X5_9TELE
MHNLTLKLQYAAHTLLPAQAFRDKRESSPLPPLPHFLPLLLACVHIWQLRVANRSRAGSSFKQPERRVGTANQNPALLHT